jgi:methylmalonyl-CoA mutase N-terminal domain/subunit
MEKLEALRANRNNEIVKKLLSALHESAVNGKNIMPDTINAVENYVTLGEIANTLRTVYGEYQQ